MTDFDFAVLAAARIGVLKRTAVAFQRDRYIFDWHMDGQRVSVSLNRLMKAGELFLHPRNGRIIFPDEPEWNKLAEVKELASIFRRMIRTGEIKIEKLTKGKKP